MTTETKKPLVVYHDNCADGFGAAWAAYKKFGADDKGTAMNELFDQQLADITKYPVPTSLYVVEGSCGRFGMSVNCTPQFASEAGDVLAQLSGTFGMTWCVGEKGQVFVSLRSIGDYDVSVIAKAFGGGGHKNAAGFKTAFDKLGYNGDGELEIRV